MGIQLHMAREVNVYDYGSIDAYEYRFIPLWFTASVTVVSDLVLYVQKEKNFNFKIAQKALARPHESFVQTKKCMYSMPTGQTTSQTMQN